MPFKEEWIRKMWYIYTMEYYAAEKNNDIMKFAGKWMELENVILSETSLPQEMYIFVIVSLFCYYTSKMRTCGLLPGWYGLTSQDLLTTLQMFQNPDQLQDNWLKDEASQTAPVKIGASS
ncbi:hypothetical protein STEG23_027736 [Scotinomys teguina]